MRHLAGTGTLLRLALRRDRVRLTVWIVAIVATAGYCVAALDIAYPTDRDLGAIVSFVDGPAGTIMTGPGYGLDDPTRATVFAAVYALYLFVAVAFMNVFLVVRHTRADEETGRTELVRTGVVGRHAVLAAAAVLAVAADVVVGVLVAVVLATPFGFSGAVLLGASMTVVGLSFAGIAIVAVQLSESARAAKGLGSAVIGLAVVVRGVGDVLQQNGSPLSWLSPFAWAQQTRVLDEPRVWPLLPGLALAVVGLAVGAVLQGRRDVGAGLLTSRLGRGSATPRLSSVWALALRLERSSILWWTVGVGLVGALYGALADSVQSSFADLPDDLLEVLGGGGGSAQLLDGFVSVMVLLDAILAACCGVAVLHRLSAEEGSGRAEVVLATATSRVQWLGAGLAASWVGVCSVLAASGLGMGLAVAGVLGDSERVPQVLLAHLAYVPAVAVVVAVAGLGYAVRPRVLGVAWIVVGFGVFAGFFGPVVDLPRWVADLSPFEHVARMPMDGFEPGPFVVMGVLAIAIGATGLVMSGRRDLATG